MDKRLQKIIIAFSLGALLTVGGLWLGDKSDELKWFCDAFSLSGVALLTIAGWSFLLKNGAFLGIGYALRRVTATLLPFQVEKTENYRDYRDRKIAKRKHGETPYFLIAGLFYLAVASILLCFYAKI
jgi:hypothetical protein